MKYIIKPLASFLSLIVFAGFLSVAPVTVTAQVKGEAAGNRVKATSTEAAAKNFCKSFSVLADKYKKNIDEQISKLEDKINTEAKNIQNDRQKFDDNLDKVKQNWGKERLNIYNKLSAKATTDAQKQALAIFKAAVDAAITARENAIEAARTAYRQGVDQIIAQRKNEILQAFSSYKSNLASVLQQAANNCASDSVSSTNIRQIYQNNLETIKEARINAIQTIDKIGPKIKELTKTRNAAIQQAIKTYQSALQSAIAALKAAFPQTNLPKATTTENNL